MILGRAGKMLFSKTQRRALRESAKDWDLESALDALDGPLRAWIHRPSSEGKGPLMSAYSGLGRDERRALEADVLRAVRRHHGGPSFIAYRRIKGGSEVLSGLDSVTTDRASVDYLDPAQWREYTVEAPEVLVHWGQDTPLRRTAFKHEKEVILKPGVTIHPTRRGGT